MTKKTTKNLPVKAKSTELITVNQEKISPLDITQKLHHLKSRADVRKYLPDILGRVLARIWIDTGFKEEFAKDPQKTLEFNGVYLGEALNTTINYNSMRLLVGALSLWSNELWKRIIKN